MSGLYDGNRGLYGGESLYRGYSGLWSGASGLVNPPATGPSPGGDPSMKFNEVDNSMYVPLLRNF